MDQGEPHARSPSSPLAGKAGWGGWSALLCCHSPPCPFPARGNGVAPTLVLLPSVVGLDLNPFLTGSPST
jgi:hypothetical protein